MADVTLKESVLAIITHRRDAVAGGGAPIFYSKDEDESSKIALYLARILNGMVHEVGDGIYIIVKH
jgi:hypothetical protein